MDACWVYTNCLYERKVYDINTYFEVHIDASMGHDGNLYIASTNLMIDRLTVTIKAKKVRTLLECLHLITCVRVQCD